MKKTLLVSSLFISALANAQTKSAIHASKWHYASQLDGSIFSTAITSGTNAGDPIVRYAPFFNIGHTIHNEFNNYSGAILGVGIKNIGFIEKRGDTTFKKRVYAFGVNAALKFGDMKTNRFGFIGAGVDLLLLSFGHDFKFFVDKSNPNKKHLEFEM